MHPKSKIKLNGNARPKSLRYLLQLYDGVWSIPLAFLFFFLAGYGSYTYFGDALISTEYIQYIVLAALVMVVANFVVFMGLYFNFRTLQRMVYSAQIKQQALTDLSTWQKIVLYVVLYFAYFAAFLYILHLLMTVTA
jgi:hypothetical protein